MRRRSLAALTTALCLTAGVAAQSTEAPTRGDSQATDSRPAESRGPFGGRLHVGGVGGAAAVQRVGGLAGGEIGIRISDRFEAFGEGLWMADVVTRRQANLAGTVGSFLQASQGVPSSGRVVAPAAYGGAGLRVALVRRPGYRLYGVVTAGGAHVALQPTFTVAGADVTGVLEQYGVQLGRDLSSEVTRSAFGGGAGLRIPRGRWFLDGSVRLTSIRLRERPANVIHANAALGLRF